jgi:hypothetical protein
MLSKGKTDTRTKIMEAAFELFGRFGLEGASVRDIAAKSEVNLAAVNYHFHSKENLFWEIMSRTYSDLDEEISRLANDSKDVHELSLKTFDHFLAQKFALKNTMKMMLAEDAPLPKDPKILEQLNNPMGPPGGIYYADMIQKEISYPLSREGLLWGVKAVFGAIFHWGVMCCSDKLCGGKNGLDPLMEPEQIRKDVAGMVEAAIIFLNSQRQRFEAKE